MTNQASEMKISQQESGKSEGKMPTARRSSTQKKRRVYTPFTELHKEHLLAFFAQNPSPPVSERMKLSVMLGKPQDQISRWFTNRRFYLKRHNTENVSTELKSSPKTNPEIVEQLTKKRKIELPNKPETAHPEKFTLEDAVKVKISRDTCSSFFIKLFSMWNRRTFRWPRQEWIILSEISGVDQTFRFRSGLKWSTNGWKRGHQVSPPSLVSLSEMRNSSAICRKKERTD